MSTKRLLWLLALVAVAYVAYQYHTKGQVTVLEPVLEKGPRSTAEKSLDELEQRFKALKKRFEESEVSDNELMNMRREAGSIARELKKLGPSITKNSDKATLGRLQMEIRKFKDEVL